MKLQFATIVHNREIADQVFEMRLKIALDHPSAGQFIHIKVGKENRMMLRRPISIAQIHEDGITIIFRVNGEGTLLLSQYKANEQLDVLGPLGNGYDLNKIKGKVVLFGGGIGVPPMYELACQLKQNQIECICVLGFNSKKDVFYEQAFQSLYQTIVTTVDGSYGIKGFVTDALKEDFDMFCACGPIPMLKALETKYNDKPGFISIEKRMACGIGACYACVCNKQEDYTRVCIDGPVYKARGVELCD